MTRFLKAVSALALGVLLFACDKNDDNVTITPPRPYAPQYAMESDSIEKYLKTHYIFNVDADFNIDIRAINPDDATPPVAIWDQTQYPLQNKIVEQNGVTYTLYYLNLNEGGGEQPTPYDNVKVAYRGTLLDGSQFDFNPVPENYLPLQGTIEGWREIIPLFKAGTYVDIPNDPNPATYVNPGAGVMFLPSDFGYYEIIREGIPAYSPIVFSFKLLDVEYADNDSDGILTRDETDGGTNPGKDTDGDGTPDYLDVDDDGDGFTTKFELESGVDCDNNVNTPPTIHLDPTCHP